MHSVYQYTVICNIWEFYQVSCSRCVLIFYLSFLCPVHMVISYRYSLRVLMTMSNCIFPSGHAVKLSSAAYKQYSLWLSSYTLLGQVLPVLLSCLFLAYCAVSAPCVQVDIPFIIFSYLPSLIKLIKLYINTK